jgi:hypothetical protein
MIVKSHTNSVENKAASISARNTCDMFWHLLVSDKPATTVLDYILQPDPLRRAFKPMALQKLIQLHGPEVFSSSCSSLDGSTSHSHDLLSLCRSSAASAQVATTSWIQGLASELVDGLGMSEVLSRELLSRAVAGTTLQKDISQFLQKLVEDLVLCRVVPWFTYLNIEKLTEYGAFVEKSTLLFQQHPALEPCVQAFLLHMAVCPYFIPFDELAGAVQVCCIVLCCPPPRCHVPGHRFLICIPGRFSSFL